MGIPRVLGQVGAGLGLRFSAMSAGGGRDVNRRQNAEDVGLNHAGEQAERRHDDRKEKRRDRQQDADDHHAAHHVAEQANGQRQRARELR